MRNFFSRFFAKNNRIVDIPSASIEEDINVLEIEEENQLNQDEEIEFIGLHESALREDQKFQRLGNEKKKAIFQEKQYKGINGRKIR